MKNKNVVVFDICGTLYNSNTTMDFCEWRCKSKLKKLLLRSLKKVPIKAFNKLSSILFGIDFIRIININSLKGQNVREIENEAIKFVDTFLFSKKINLVHDCLHEFNRKDILLLSATITPVAKAISQKLGGIEYLSTSLEIINSVYTGKIEIDLLGKKHNFINGSDIEFIITDNLDDIEICKLSSRVVIVTKEKNVEFWIRQNLSIEQLIKV